MTGAYNNYISWAYASGATTYQIISEMLYNFSSI